MVKLSKEQIKRVQEIYKHFHSQFPDASESMKDRPEEFLAKFLIPTLGSSTVNKHSLLYFASGIMREKFNEKTVATEETEQDWDAVYDEGMYLSTMQESSYICPHFKGLE